MQAAPASPREVRRLRYRSRESRVAYFRRRSSTSHRQRQHRLLRAPRPSRNPLGARQTCPMIRRALDPVRYAAVAAPHRLHPASTRRLRARRSRPALLMSRCRSSHSSQLLVRTPVPKLRQRPVHAARARGHRLPSRRPLAHPRRPGFPLTSRLRRQKVVGDGAARRRTLSGRSRNQ